MNYAKFHKDPINVFKLVLFSPSNFVKDGKSFNSGHGAFDLGASMISEGKKKFVLSYMVLEM